MDTMDNKPQPPTHYSANEAAILLHRSSRTIRRWIAGGHFPNAKRSSPTPKGKFLIPVADVEIVAAKVGVVL